MKNLLQLNEWISSLNLIRNFSRLNLRDKILIIRVYILTGVMRSAMLVFSFKNLRKYMGEPNKESSFYLNDRDNRHAQKISWSINKVSKHTPWKSKCLVQSLTAQYLLSNLNIETTLYLGVSREKNNENIKKSKESSLIAHSWIRCGNFYVTGGDGENFATVAKFKKGGFR